MKRKKIKPTIIFWSFIKFKKLIHGGCLGFTHTFMKYCIAENTESAKEKIIKFFIEKHGLEIDRIEVKQAVNQDINKYCFPEHIIK